MDWRCRDNATVWDTREGGTMLETASVGGTSNGFGPPNRP